VEDSWDEADVRRQLAEKDSSVVKMVPSPAPRKVETATPKLVKTKSMQG
jgi:hypothetical protein